VTVNAKMRRTGICGAAETVLVHHDAVGRVLPGVLDALIGAGCEVRGDQAVQAALALADAGLVWLEEPTEPEDIAAHARLRRMTPVPIAAGENLHTLAEFRAYMEADAVSFPEPDVATCGGITVWMKIARLAEAFGLPVTSHGVHDLHVHLLAAAPNASYLEVHGFGLEKFIAEPLTIHDGFAAAPNRTGHGVVFDWAGLEALRL